MDVLPVIFQPSSQGPPLKLPPFPNINVQRLEALPVPRTEAGFKNVQLLPVIRQPFPNKCSSLSKHSDAHAHLAVPGLWNEPDVPCLYTLLEHIADLCIPIGVSTECSGGGDPCRPVRGMLHSVRCYPFISIRTTLHHGSNNVSNSDKVNLQILAD